MHATNRAYEPLFARIDRLANEVNSHSHNLRHYLEHSSYESAAFVTLSLESAARDLRAVLDELSRAQGFDPEPPRQRGLDLSGG